LLHFQAVDHDATVWVEGTEVVRHRGGWSPFTADLGWVVELPREITVVVRARDSKVGVQARGKQLDRFENDGLTPTTGIWQTVWLEPVPETYFLRARITPDVAGGAFHLGLPIRGPRAGLSVRARLSDQAGELASAEVRADRDFSVQLNLPVPSERRRLWSPNDPFLFDLEFELVRGDGSVVDRVKSYAGLRSITIDGKAVLLNGQPIFQRLVLDQGYYPDGIMTAPSEDALVRDIELAREAGFNGARLHQKVFEERFLYHCDRLGFLVWGEFGDGGANTNTAVDNQQPTASFVTQWLEVLERDYSHPAIIGWCPLNETFETLHDRISVLDDVTRAMFLAAKAIDQTRPVLDASGFAHRVREADIYDAHNYEPERERFARAMTRVATGAPYIDLEPEAFARFLPDHDHAALWHSMPALPWSIPYDCQPYFCSEFGGIWWDEDPASREKTFGYGPKPTSVEDFYLRFEGLVSAMLANDYIFGYCYTQLTDVGPEHNGILTFGREHKFDPARLRETQGRAASIETRGSVLS
jgi:beta-galactosidase/beta-glucuronidase